MDKILLIVGHGSRSKDAVETFNRTVDLVKGKSAYRTVIGAHMEFAQPSIEEAVEKIAGDAEEIIIVPYFLFEGNHIKYDIPGKIEKLSKEYPKIVFKFGKPIGFEPAICDILIKRAIECEA